MDFESAVKKIPKGKVCTYKIIAEKIGSSPRAVGQMLKRSRNLPCHRVVMSNGRIGGYREGKKKKREILREEGVEIEGDRIKDFGSVLFYL